MARYSPEEYKTRRDIIAPVSRNKTINRRKQLPWLPRWKMRLNDKWSAALRGPSMLPSPLWSSSTAIFTAVQPRIENGPPPLSLSFFFPRRAISLDLPARNQRGRKPPRFFSPLLSLFDSRIFEIDVCVCVCDVSRVRRRHERFILENGGVIVLEHRKRSVSVIINCATWLPFSRSF